MSTRQRLDVSRTGSSGSEYTWCSIAICGMLFGLTMTMHFGIAPQIFAFPNPLDRILAWRGREAEPPAGQALIATTDLGSQLTAVATLSPRGFAPLLARNKREALSQIRNHPDTLRLAVVDATLPDYAVISRALKNVLPVRRIVVLTASTRSQDIGPMLLDRLGALQTERQPAKRGALSSASPAPHSHQPFRVM
jgi:CheY-like chemotaxis protein